MRQTSTDDPLGKSAMYFMHSEATWDQNPGLHALALVVENVSEIVCREERLNHQFIPRIEQRIAAQAESEMPEIAAWRRTFSCMGFKPTQYRCASESLIRRFRREKNIPRTHPLIDYLNFASMTFAIPIAAFDCDEIADGIVVRPADGSEMYQTFEGAVERPEPGETIFADLQGSAHSRRWTFRQSAKSIVRAHTNRALIVAEALHPSADVDVANLEDELSTLLSGEGGRLVISARLPSERRRVEF